ncbi:hypothetical protein C2L64_48720 [Paraburkholderia hospita]|uniref:Uncharacterized protein n=2 Tax=Paraburkholderia hospita TaxID=169430 RepID=A0AAN1JL51_9BURK|nr:hypothetical protein C2L64_48720 [Paraburkholderia hospita]
MRSAQSAMSESRVSRNGKGCIKQGRPQHAFGQTEYAAQTREFDVVAHRCYALRRINTRADQMHERVSGQYVGARELPQD